MSSLLAIRDTIRDYLRKFDEITTPIFRFILAYIMFSSINSMYGYSDLFERGIVVFLLSVISALVSTSVVVFLGGAVIVINSFAVGTQVGICALFIFLIMYCTYMRVFPNTGWILALVPILYMWNLPYAIPIVVMIFAGASGIVPVAFGVVIYQFGLYVEEIKNVLATASEEDAFIAYTYLIDTVLKDKQMLLEIIVYAVVILISFVVYKLPVDYIWYIAIGVAGVLNIIAFMICGMMLDVEVNTGNVIAGTILGVLLALIVQLCKSMVDYSRKETVQFEDDEYYYYVKAIPKYNVSAKKKNVVKINEQVEEATQAIQ
ncbi:MAG: hypothetical protein IJO70_03795 [Lachnospiraceae bacterium]|nr:hypothetical protein [Lachnospiraceae bacterium]